MITLPNGLNALMKGQNLDGLKPFALLYRNKWDSVNNKYALEDTPIDISALIAKPNTLSMTLDVNEVAQYNANNVTLTLSDTKNYFVEGTPNSYFPEGYQIYGSRIVLYYGTDGVNRTPLFTGVIKDLPTHKPENYQVDVKLVSPLEMLKDIEAKDFSDKVTGETLTYIEDDNDGHKVYNTTGKGVGGFDAVYADGVKLFEGVDYQVDQLNELLLPAEVTIINSDLYSATITADYYTWKTGLTVEQIVAGLVGLAGYDTGTEDIRAVAWNTIVRNPPVASPVFAALGYYEDGVGKYKFLWEGARNAWNYSYLDGGYNRRNILPDNFDYSFFFLIHTTTNQFGGGAVSLGDEYSAQTISYNGSLGEAGVKNGISIRFLKREEFILRREAKLFVFQITNGVATIMADVDLTNFRNPQGTVKIERRGSTINIFLNGTQICSFTEARNFPYQRSFYRGSAHATLENQSWSFYDSALTPIGGTLTNPCIVTMPLDKTLSGNYWGAISADLGDLEDRTYFLNVATSNDSLTWSELYSANLNTVLAYTERYIYYVLGIANNPSAGFDIENPTSYYFALTLLVNLVNLSGLTVLEALQDLSLISGYEFGVDRQGVFFFRPRVSSTTPIYILDHNEIVKVDTVKKNLSDFFTKLTLTFAQVPLEFYANTGERPTLVDKYGIINKEIDKPDIVNYDNPELAQAIGPQLLEVYSSLPNIIQVTGKLNLALELGDIVSLRRNMNLITPEGYTDYSKYTDLNTYYRACKITGMNYNFSKRQITYTLRDVSNKNTAPQYEFNEYVYDFAVQYGVKE